MRHDHDPEHDQVNKSAYLPDDLIVDIVDVVVLCLVVNGLPNEHLQVLVSLRGR